MIFISKRTSGSEYSSNKESCLSIIGLLLAIGFIAGIGGLIYGLVKVNLWGTIAGAIVLGISVFLGIIFILFIIFCLKNNNVNSNTNDQSHHHYQQQQNRPIKHENSSHEITTISSIQKYEQQNEFNTQIFSPSVPMRSTNNTNYNFGKQTSTFDFLNQSNSSTNSNNLRQYNSNQY